MNWGGVQKVHCSCQGKPHRGGTIWGGIGGHVNRQGWGHTSWLRYCVINRQGAWEHVWCLWGGSHNAFYNHWYRHDLLFWWFACTHFPQGVRNVAGQFFLESEALGHGVFLPRLSEVIHREGKPGQKGNPMRLLKTSGSLISTERTYSNVTLRQCICLA